MELQQHGEQIMKKSMIVAISVLAIIGIGLATRHSDSQNILLTADKNSAAEFLYHAEGYASQKTHVYYATGSVYSLCVTDPSHFDNPFDHSAKNPCGAYLESMLSYSEKSKQFNNITMSDLNNKAVVDRLSDALFSYESTGGPAH